MSDVQATLADHDQWYHDRRKHHEEDLQFDHAFYAKMMRDLAEPFPAEMERTVTKSGTTLTYIPVSEVITRLNRVIGVGNWSSEIIRCERDAIDPDFVVAHVRLTVYVNLVEARTRIIKDGIGGQKIKRSRKDNEIIDLGDEMKGAVSDALKKAAQQLGVGLYLARDAEAIELDEAMHTPAPAAQEPLVDKDASPYEKFISLKNSLNEEQVAELRSFWATWSGGRPVPKRSEFTDEELRILITECIRLLFGGEYASAVGSDE